MILADKRDYGQGCKKHYSVYYKLMETNTNINSKRSLLSYCAEYGLKYLLLGKWHEENPEKIIGNKKDKRRDVLKSHNLEKILKELGQLGTFRFPQLITARQGSITSEDYYQLCRYCIRVEDEDRVKEDKYEIELKKTADWTEGGT